MMTDVTPLATPDLQAKAVELIDQLTAGLKAVAPQMADVTLAAIRFQGVMDLASTVMSTAESGLLFYIAYRCVKWASKQPLDSIEFPTIPAIGMCIAGAATSIMGAVLAVTSASDLLATQTWAAIIDPRLALALRVINKLM